MDPRRDFVSRGDIMNQRCPTPECLRIIDQANAFVLERPAGLSLEPYISLRATDDYWQLMDTLIDALAAGDLEQTKTICRDWIRLTVSWIRRHQPTEPAHNVAPQEERPMWT